MSLPVFFAGFAKSRLGTDEEQVGAREALAHIEFGEFVGGESGQSTVAVLQIALGGRMRVADLRATVRPCTSERVSAPIGGLRHVRVPIDRRVRYHEECTECGEGSA